MDWRDAANQWCEDNNGSSSLKWLRDGLLSDDIMTDETNRVACRSRRVDYANGADGPGNEFQSCRIFLSVAVLVLALSACQSSDLALQVTRPPLPQTYDRVPHKMMPSGSTGLAWWDSFHDKTLSSLVLCAENMNLTIALARQNLTAARVMAHSAMATYQPEGSISGLANAASGSRVNNDFTRRPLQLNLEVGWETALFGQDRHTQDAADLAAGMAAEDLAAARLAVMTEIASDYVHLRALQKRRVDTAELISLSENNAKLASVKEQAGLSTPMETEPLRSGLNAAKSAMAALDNDIASTRQQIATLLGSSVPDPALLKAQPQPIVTADLSEGRPADILRLRPDVLRAEFAVAQAGARVGIAKSDLYPKLRLSGTIGIGAPVSHSLLGAMGGPSLQLPIFDYGRRKDVVAAREAEFHQAVFAYKQAVLLAYQEASQALHELNSARARTALLRSRLQRVSKLRTSADILVQEGLADRSKSIAGAIDLLELRMSLTESIENEARAAIAFYKATRGAQPLATVEGLERSAKAKGQM